MRFEDMAEAAGLPRKPFYTVREVSKATGIPESTVRKAVALGDMPSYLPPWKVRGVLVGVEQVDDWIEGMMRNARRDMP